MQKYIKMCENMYNTSVIIDEYCQKNIMTDELQNLSALTHYLRKQCDKLLYEITKER